MHETLRARRADRNGDHRVTRNIEQFATKRHKVCARVRTFVGTCLIFAFVSQGANANRLALEADPNPSTTGDYSLTWTPLGTNYKTFTLYECQGDAASCTSFGSYTANGVRLSITNGRTFLGR